MPDGRNNDSLTEGIFPEGHYSLPDLPPEVPQWKPWHKPRKQWIRYNQWNKEIENLTKKLRLSDRPLTYLSLPGDDLLDFRIVAELCQDKGVNVKLVGFNKLEYSHSKEDVRVAINEVFAHSVVVENSDIHSDDFNKISDTDSVAHKFADEKGPYDVINLDLCDSFSGTDEDESYYKAMVNLIKIQRLRGEPWIFLLTTRGDSKKVNIRDCQKFWGNIRTNVTGSRDFKNRLEKGFLTESYDSIGNIIDYMKQLSSPKFEKLFGLFLGKWLLGVIGPSRRWTVKLLDSYWYRTNSARDSTPNMLSLAFLFEQIESPIVDPTGLAQPEVSQQEKYDEESQAIGIIKGVNSLIDIDIHLHNNKSQFEDSIVKSEQLLKKAGYDTASYRSWVNGVLPPAVR